MPKIKILGEEWMPFGDLSLTMECRECGVKLTRRNTVMPPIPEDSFDASRNEYFDICKNCFGKSDEKLRQLRQEKFLSEYETLCRKHQLIIDSQCDAMFIVVPEAVIDIIPRPIPGTGAREYENHEVKTQSIDEHIAHLRGNS